MIKKISSLSTSAGDIEKIEMIKIRRLCRNGVNIKTSAPIAARKFKFRPFLGNYDPTTDRPTDEQEGL